MSFLVEILTTREKFNALPISEKPDSWQSMEIGTYFRSQTKEVIFKVVEGMDMFAHQWGAGMSLPKKGLQQFRPIFTEETHTL